MTGQPKQSPFAIIIPAFNEEGRIGATIAGIRKVSDADIVVVNDGSDDGTASEAKAAGAVVIELPSNLGYGAALQTGFKYALDRGYEFAVQMDADGQHDPMSIGTLIEPVIADEVDVTIGSRFMDKGNYKAPFVRRMGMYFFGLIASLFTGRKITDPTSGFQALNKKVMEFYASDAYPADYPDADVIIMLHRQGFRFKEVPVIMHNAAKRSMHGGILKPLYYIFKMMLSIFVTLLRKE
ncbi:MAG: glycosyltransferase family 2 protein [Thermodesulfovibrionales bacterium]|nr:glycosyltransferase family 2 protein [Thermodesulfovibrionales bacterium]